jgi:hypothetical protein
VIFNMAGRSGEQNKQVWLGCDEPKQPYFDLWLTGVRQKAFEMIPDVLQFGSLTAGKEQVQTLAITNLLDVATTLKSVSSSIKNVEAKVIESADWSWVIQVAAKPLTTQDRLRGTIPLDFSSGRVNVPESLSL